MRFKDILNEAFDSPYRIRQSGTNEYSFVTDAGNEYRISFFMPREKRLWLEYQERYFPLLPLGAYRIAEVEFELITDGQAGYKFLGGDKRINSVDDNPQRIFATVLSTVFWFTRQKNIDLLAFSGESKLGVLYERMIRRYLPRDYLMLKGTGSDTARFIIYHKHIKLE